MVVGTSKIISFIFILIASASIGICCDWNPEIPQIPETTIICHPSLMIIYDENVKLPVMSYAINTQEEVWKLEGGRKEFSYDPSIPISLQHSIEDEIFKTPMSRGHLTPSSIMSYDKSKNGAWYETYYITNVLPQNAKMNEVPWEHFEERIVNSLKTEPNGTEWEIYTGGFWNNTRNDNPDYFWKAFCQRTSCSSGLIMATHQEEPEWTTAPVNTIGNIFTNCCPEHYNNEWDKLLP